jgi:hypothetical protein
MDPLPSDSDSDDDIPVTDCKIESKVKEEEDKGRRHEATPPAAMVESSDSDDDVPIGQLKVETVKVKTEGKSNGKVIKFKQQACSESIYKTAKGQLVCAILCRWWYAIKWPAEGETYDVCAFPLLLSNCDRPLPTGRN